MFGIVRQGDAATCGHTSTGSQNVFINSRGVARVGIDAVVVVGTIFLGPNNKSTVFANGAPISVQEDRVLPHGHVHGGIDWFRDFYSQNVKIY